MAVGIQRYCACCSSPFLYTDLTIPSELKESPSLLYMHSEAEYRIAADLRDNVMRGDTPTGGDTCGPLHRE